MGLTKYTQAERPVVLSPHDHKKIDGWMKQQQKTSARELSEDERKSLQIALDSED